MEERKITVIEVLLSRHGTETMLSVHDADPFSTSSCTARRSFAQASRCEITFRGLLVSGLVFVEFYF